MPSNPATLVRRFLVHSACTVSDALDRLNLQGAPRGILPLWAGSPRIAGRAATMRLLDEGPASPVRGTLETIAAAGPGDVLVIDHGGRLDVNSFGGIASYTAKRRRLAGVVIDGVTRDIDEIKALRFPAFGRGVIQQSVRGRCAFGGRGVEVGLGGVLVRPGDLVVADANGAVVVPWDRVEEVLRIAQECAADEKKVRAWIASGKDPAEAHQRVRYEKPADGAAR